MAAWTRKRRKAQSVRARAQALRNRLWEHSNRPWEKAVGECKARHGNLNRLKTGLQSRVVRRFRRLEREYRADRDSLDKLEAAENARLDAILFVQAIAAATNDPVVKTDCMAFVTRQIQLAERRYGAMMLVKGNRWA